MGGPRSAGLMENLWSFNTDKLWTLITLGCTYIDENNNNNNNNCQGYLSLGESFQIKGWAMWQFGLIIALCHINIFLAYDYLKYTNLKNDEEFETKTASFTWRLAKELIKNDMWVRQNKNEAVTSTVLPTAQIMWGHVLMQPRD